MFILINFCNKLISVQILKCILSKYINIKWNFFNFFEFQASADRIKAHLNKAEYYMALLRAYEARDRSIMDANYSRVTFWSLLNAFVLVAVGVVQVCVRYSD